MFTTILHFRCARSGIAAAADPSAKAGPDDVFFSLDAAERACSDRIHVYVTDPVHFDREAEVPGHQYASADPSRGTAFSQPEGDRARIRSSAVPSPPADAAAVWVPVNVGPYRAPRAVDAAGGILVRTAGEGREVLLIHRRGVWDLPKGKRDRGESLEECARREVCEELGIEEVVIDRPAGRTVHGYVDGGKYAVKSTYWFLMRTDEAHFHPEEEEGIDAAAWMPWRTAVEHLGFAVLRRHLEAVGASPPRV